MKTRKHVNRGYSLIELAITLVVIAILASIALPAYRQYILRGHRTDATRALQDLAAREESYFFSNNAYASSLTTLGAASSTQGNYFSLGVASASSTAYSVTATAQGAQTKDTACTAFALNQAGQQTSSGTGTAATCWGSQ
jgi:type IV pilus assembly protein PilE